MSKAEDVAKLTQPQKEKFGWLASDSGYNDINTLEKQIKQAYDAAQKMGKPLYLGEFGVIHGADEPSRIRWYKDIVALCTKYGIGYTAWDYKGGFGIIRNGKIQHEMIKALVGK